MLTCPVVEPMGPIGWMVDKICERLNWLTDWKSDDVDRTEKLTAADAPPSR